MTIDDIRDYCLKKHKTTESFPFDEDVLVFKVLGKMYALTSLKGWEEGQPKVNLKCNPEYAIELREQYESIISGFHMHNKHWNTVHLNQGDLNPKFIFELIDHSYDMVLKAMPKKLRATLND